MLLSTNQMTGYGLHAKDGQIGEVTALLFDDRTFDVRYFACRTMKWLGREIILSPEAFSAPDWSTGTVPVDLTKEQIKASPDIDVDAPVSRHKLQQLHAHYGWVAAYGYSVPAPPPTVAVAEQERADSTERVDPHLRSTKALVGMFIEAKDGEIGHVEDFIVDTDAWKIRYMIVDTRNWLPGKKVYVLPDDILAIDWTMRTVRIGLLREQVENGTKFDPKLPINREVETRLLDFYGRPYYWN